jgi:hypothetical protein
MTRNEASKQIEYATAKMLRATAWEFDLRQMHEKAKGDLDAAEVEVRVSRKHLAELDELAIDPSEEVVGIVRAIISNQSE